MSCTLPTASKHTMVKRDKARKAAKAGDKAGEREKAQQEEDVKAKAALQRLGKKKVQLQARRQAFLTKVKSSSSARLAGVQGGVHKKLGAKRRPLPGLDTLSAALNDVQRTAKHRSAQQAGPTGASVDTSKERHRIQLQEAERLQRVLKHPLYKLDPIQAITNHLANVLPPAPAAGKAQQSSKARQAAGQGKPNKKPKQR